MLYKIEGCKEEFDLGIDPKFFAGIILDKRVCFALKSSKATHILSANGVCANIIYVLNECVYVISTVPTKYAEYNSTLNMYSSKDGFWRTEEIEYKIEIENDINILPYFACSENGNFAFSKIDYFKNYERYFAYKYGDRVEYIAILGKKNWKRKMGIKHKVLKKGQILTRDVTIVPYSESLLEDYVEKIFGGARDGIRRFKLNTYFKKKWRLICVDKKCAIVYGVSYTVSKPITKKLNSLCQIEIEYWSNIVENDSESIGSIEVNYSSFLDLVDIITNYLTKIGVKWVAPGRTKVEWLVK